MENKYFDITMDEVYDLLTHHKNPWPKNFSKVRKLQLLDNIIEYYQEQELFERCTILIKLREAVLIQSIKQQTKTIRG
jgi:hypothetical protein